MTNPLQDLSFQTLFDAVSDAMLLVDDSGHVVQTNAAAQLLLGYAEEEICSLEVEALMPLRYREHHRHYREAFNKNPEKRTMGSVSALTALRGDGTELEVNVGLSPINTGEQLYTLVMLSATDRRRQSEEALKISEERLRLAKQAAELGVFDFDSDSNILHWDDRMRELWGAESTKAVTNKRFITSIHPEDRAARKAALDAAIDPTGSGEYQAEYRVVNPADNVERWVSATGRMHFEDGLATRLIGVARDVTEHKAFERKMQEQRAETETLFMQQVAAQTASAIAHELNQPLAAISAYSEVALHALQHEADPVQLKRALEGCVAQSQRAGKSLHELMAFLQKGKLLTEKLAINDLVKDALIIAKSNGLVGFYPILQLEENMPAVLGNRIQVQKILMNLLRNAVEAMQGAGASTSAITIIVKTNKDINMAHVTVQDNGPGLSPETAKRIFEPFFTTKPSGLGMGLAVSRSLAEANGGQLWLEPNAKSGATFHFTLPFAS